tara:strand:+ start:1093 stop:2211 length:1119 start_codon:yes stop_codon:yes gene_type:complete
MKKVTFIFNLSVLVLLTAYGCSSSDSEDINTPNNNNNTIIPTNLVVSLDIQGQDENNPNGDGSGVFNMLANANNAVRYGFKVGTADEVDSPSGNFTYTVNTQGLNQFPVTIYAYSTSENSISKIQNITIFVEANDSGNGGSGNNDVLVWSDEFNGSGAINTNNWTYEIGGGGWGNQEVQSYTNSLNNVYKENGILKIKVIKESNNTYTSGRIITKNKFDFKYGRVDIRAKLPTIAGTWPALWMLGANINSVSWPSCGEIDIMEQFEDKSYVQSTCHWQSSSTTNYAPVSYGLPVDLNTPTEFHIYSLIWSEGSIKTLLDGNQFYAMNTNSTMPFDASFFFIFNVAMGGTNGGTIDPNFTSDAMEVDYIRVYQ